MTTLKDKICEELDLHEAVTRIVYTDTDERLQYVCNCGESSEGSELLDREWLVKHLTDKVMDTLFWNGVDNMQVED